MPRSGMQVTRRPTYFSTQMQKWMPKLDSWLNFMLKSSAPFCFKKLSIYGCCVKEIPDAGVGDMGPGGKNYFQYECKICQAKFHGWISCLEMVLLVVLKIESFACWKHIPYARVRDVGSREGNIFSIPKAKRDEIQNGISCFKMVLIPVFKIQAFWLPGEQISSCWGQWWWCLGGQFFPPTQMQNRTPELDSWCNVILKYGAACCFEKLILWSIGSTKF